MYQSNIVSHFLTNIHLFSEGLWKLLFFCEAGKHEKLKPYDVKIAKTEIGPDFLNCIMMLELKLAKTVCDFFKKTVKTKTVKVVCEHVTLLCWFELISNQTDFRNAWS